VSRRRPRVAAHRGGAALWPENSLRAFAEAIALGCDLIELDVHASADAQVVVIHDPGLERTTTGRGPVAAQPAAALRELRLRGPDGAVTTETVPMLDDVFRLVAGTAAGVLVELKARTEGFERLVLDVVRGAGFAGRANVMCFDAVPLARLRVVAPDVRTTLLVGRERGRRASSAELLGWLRAADAVDLGLQHTLVTADVVAAAHAAGVAVGAWTVDEAADIERLAELGIDLVTTDRPDVALRALGA
jgi:glycerophosphoryl diester phosphodiesterase